MARRIALFIIIIMLSVCGCVSTNKSIKKIDKALIVVDSDDRFVRYSNGIIEDRKNLKQWYLGPIENLQWDDAQKWVKHFTLKNPGWRLPTIEELSSLYKHGVAENNISTVFNHPGKIVYSAETIDNYWVKVYFFSMGEGDSHLPMHWCAAHVFVVRNFK